MVENLKTIHYANGDSIPLVEDNEWINLGDTVVYKPFGGVAAGQLHKEKGLLFAEIDVKAARASRRKFDASWLYPRPEVFSLSVDWSVKKPVTFH